MKRSVPDDSLAPDARKKQLAIVLLTDPDPLSMACIFAPKSADGARLLHVMNEYACRDELNEFWCLWNLVRGIAKHSRKYSTESVPPCPSSRGQDEEEEEEEDDEDESGEEVIYRSDVTAGKQLVITKKKEEVDTRARTLLARHFPGATIDELVEVEDIDTGKNFRLPLTVRPDEVFVFDNVED